MRRLLLLLGVLMGAPALADSTIAERAAHARRVAVATPAACPGGLAALSPGEVRR
jgi:hypothetical protein